MISLPVIVTLDLPASTFDMNSLNFRLVGSVWKRVEKFQTSTPTRTRTIQNTRLFRVEFKNSSQQTEFSRVSLRRGLLLY